MTQRSLVAAAVPFDVKSTKAMIKLISFLTFTLVLGAAAVGLLSPSATNAVTAREDVTSTCPLAQVALDEGYGVTRTEMRPVCPSE